MSKEFPAIEVFAAVQAERQYQDDKWGKTGHTLAEWVLIMESELEEAKTALIKGGFGRDAIKAEIIQVLAVGFACLEQHGLDPVEKRAV